MTKYVNVIFTAEVDEKGIDELKSVVSHHLDGLIDLESWPEIKTIYAAEMIEGDDRSIFFRDLGKIYTAEDFVRNIGAMLDENAKDQDKEATKKWLSGLLQMASAYQ